MEIGVILTGGTIGSCKGKTGIAPAANAPQTLFAAYSKKTEDTTVFPVETPYTLLSENITFTHIRMLTACILEKSAVWNGIIVTHGTDTLQYTAAALSYLLGLCKVPVVLVSANFPLGDPRSNGLENFTAAVTFLREAKHAKGVYVAYQNTGEVCHIYRAPRLLPHAAYSDGLSSLEGVVATVQDKKIQYATAFSEQPDGQLPFSAENFERIAGQIPFLRTHPDMCYPRLNGVSAVLIETYHSGTLATATPALQRFATNAAAQGIPIFLTGVPAGGTAYESGNPFEKLHLRTLPPMSPIAAYIKLCLAIANGRNPAQSMVLPLGGDL